MCIESVSRVGKELGREEDTFDDIPVRRISFNMGTFPDPLRWSFSNPLLGKEASSLFEAFRPDVLLAFSGNLLSGDVIVAAQQKSIPVFLMTTDYWFLCPRITLLKPDGSLCHNSGCAASCAACLCLDKRRYRILSRLSGGMTSRLLAKIWRLPFLAKIMGKKEMVDALEERQIFLKEVFHKIELAVSESRFLKSLLLARGFEPQRFLQIRQGIKLPESKRSDDKKPGFPLRIGYIGQIAPHKGVHVLLMAFNRLSKDHPRCVLKIYGDLSRHQRYVRQLRKLAGEKETVDFCGPFDHGRVYEILNKIDILVVPSLWFENSPNVILEAFASRTPVVTSNSGGMAELIENEVNGLLFRRGDAKDLCRALSRLSDETELLDALRRGIRPVKEEAHEWEEIIQLSNRLVDFCGAGALGEDG